MDFEKGARKACLEEMNIAPSGCLFHLVQCWLRKAGKEGLNKKERNNMMNLIFYMTYLSCVHKLR